jgi:hypothetical protein
MVTSENVTFLDHGPVRIGAEGVSEIDAGRPLVHFPRPDINALELAWGSGAERPIIALVLGLFVVALALSGPSLLVLAILRHGTIPAKFLTTIVFIIPAWWLLDLALRRRWYLLVHTSRGNRKLLFAKGSAREDLERYVLKAKGRFGYA